MWFKYAGVEGAFCDIRSSVEAGGEGSMSCLGMQACVFLGGARIGATQHPKEAHQSYDFLIIGFSSRGSRYWSYGKS